MFKGSERISQFPEENVWTEYTRETPEFIKEATIGAIKTGPLSYARPAGDLELCNKVAEIYGPLLNRKLDPLKEVLITNGASGAIFDIFQGVLNPKDEVIILEPYFNQYEEWVLIASGVPVIVPLDTIPNQNSSNTRWQLNEKVLRNAITSKTKIIILNTPVNPTGKLFSKKEIEIIAKIAIEFNLIVLSDEVYEYLCFGDVTHERIATYPDMWDRTYTVTSSSKTFSVTGYKIGWIIGPKHLIEFPFKVMQSSTFCVTTPLQKGVARSLGEVVKNKYLEKLPEMFKTKCDYLCKAFEDIFGEKNIIRPDGGYFIIVNITPLSKFVKFDEKLQKDDQICRWLIKEVGITSIPMSQFIKSGFDDGCQYSRFCFAKKDETLEETVKRLQKLKEMMK